MWSTSVRSFYNGEVRIKEVYARRGSTVLKNTIGDSTFTTLISPSLFSRLLILFKNQCKERKLISVLYGLSGMERALNMIWSDISLPKSDEIILAIKQLSLSQLEVCIVITEMPVFPN